MLFFHHVPFLGTGFCVFKVWRLVSESLKFMIHANPCWMMSFRVNRAASGDNDSTGELTTTCGKLINNVAMSESQCVILTEVNYDNG